MNKDRPFILIVDDEASIRESFSLILQDDYNIITASTGEAALKKAVDNKIDLVFLDIRMPGMDGMETLKMLKDIDESIEVIMVTAINDVQKAGEAIQIGADNYIVKPFDVDQIIAMAKALTGKKSLKYAAKQIRQKASKELSFPEFLGQSKYAQNIMPQIDNYAGTDTPLMIFGEPGTEKEAVAFLVHSKSRRKDSAFLTLNISKDDNEKDLFKKLFGIGKGTFVYDLGKGTGMLEEASGGTILINNIENAPQKIHEALIEMMDKKTIKRAGSSEGIQVNTRLIFSSSAEPRESEEPNIFDKVSDSISISPLRDRREDIQDITTGLIEQYNESLNRNVKGISNDAQEVLNSYPWPANMAELANTIKRPFISGTKDNINTLDMSFDILMNSGAVSYIEEAELLSLNGLSAEFDKEFILKILKRTNFDTKLSAKILGINPAILTSKIETLEIK